MVIDLPTQVGNNECMTTTAAILHETIVALSDADTADRLIAVLPQFEIELIETFLAQELGTIEHHASSLLYQFEQGKFSKAVKETRKEDLKEVVRKYKCRECGYYHQDGVTVTLEGLDPETGKFDNTGWWSCDDCGEEYFDKIRINKKDFIY